MSASERFLCLLTREQDRWMTARRRLDHTLPFHPIKLSPHAWREAHDAHAYT